MINLRANTPRAALKLDVTGLIEVFRRGSWAFVAELETCPEKFAVAAPRFGQFFTFAQQYVI